MAMPDNKGLYKTIQDHTGSYRTIQYHIGPNPAIEVDTREYKSPKMNFKANLFFHLYETHFPPLGIPIPTVPRVSDGVG